MKQKVCYKCGTEDNLKTMINKYVKKSGKVSEYPWSICGDCSGKSQKKYYADRKKKVFDYYGNKCICCGEDSPLFLTIDHINNDGHSEVWTSNGRRITGIQLYAQIVKSNFPNKYQLMCMNCNFGKRMNKGVCPHKV